MLRHDSWSWECLLYSCAIKTWYKAILENQKLSSWFCRLLFFSKIAPGGPTKPWNLCFFQKIPRRANYIRYHTRSYIRYHTIPYHTIHTIPYHTIHTYIPYMHTMHMKHIWYIHMIHTYMGWFGYVLAMF